MEVKTIRKAKPNDYIIHGDWTELIIDSPKFGEFRIKIDTEDVPKLKEYVWCINKCWNKKTNKEPKWYAGTNGKCKADKSMLLHRFLMENPKGKIVDHIDRDTLNCTKENLRICTQSQNKMNTNRYKTNISGRTGVMYVDKLVTPKWTAYIQVNYKRKHLGYFDTYEDAVKAREKAEEKHFGEFAPID